MKMKKVIEMMMASAMVISLAACGNASTSTTKTTEEPAKEQTASEVKESPKESTEAKGPVTLNVTTTYAGNDGNAENYQQAISDWQAQTGNKVTMLQLLLMKLLKRVSYQILKQVQSQIFYSSSMG